MASFITKRFSLTTSIAKLIDVADWDRTIHIAASSSPGDLRLALDGGGDEVALFSGSLLRQFILPAGKELWGRDASSNGSVDLIVTR